MQNFARLAKAGASKAVPVAAGVVASASHAPVAQADAQQGVLPRRIQDGWEIAELVDKDLVLFKSEEIDDAISFLAGKPQSAVIEELDSDISSDGSVDAVIERGMPYAAGIAGSGQLPLDMNDLCALAARLLKSPGVQREICSAAFQDPEVFSILASKVDLPEYLESAGFAARGLLRAPEAAVEGASSSSSVTTAFSTPEDGNNSADSPNPVQQLMSKVGEGVEAIGESVARLGRWMRTQLTGQAAEPATAAADAANGAAGGQAGRSSPRAKSLDSVLGAVMVVCVAIVAVVVLRRPAALRSLFRRRAV